MAVLVCAVSVGMKPGSASAQPAGAPAGSQVNADAQQLFSDGQTATKLNQWDKARTFFQGAWRIQQHWKIAASLGRAELKVGRMRDAAEHLSFALREVPAGTLAPADLKPLEEMLAQAQAKVGTVKVTGAPAGADVLVDGVVVGKAPLKGALFLEPGAHRVVGQREGYVEGAREVAAVAGKEGGIDLGMVKVPEAKVVVTPVAEAVGPPAVGPDKRIVIAGAALGFVALAMGVGLTAVANSKANQITMGTASGCSDGMHDGQYWGCSKDLIAVESSRVTFTNVAGASFIAAGALGLGTLTYALLGGSSKAKSRATGAVVVLPGVVGATATIPW
jgi:hypothetical protein